MANPASLPTNSAILGTSVSVPPAQPPAHADVEDSIALRVLVQALVVVGIIATDVAASDVTGAWQVTSYWAVPISVVGAAWSWRTRRRRNIPAKFVIAIGMLISLVFFFGRLLGTLNDTRLALAQLLIQLQVLHSFDLPRRKDLGYSMVIGLILLGVAATLSQTLLFAPALLVFIAIALPMMVLDYRSRLGIVGSGRSSQRLGHRVAAVMPLNPKQLGILLAAVLTLGLMIFAFMPRLPGYQLRTFPVSAPIEFEGEFDATRVINPGYVRDGNQNGGDGNASAGTSGSGQGTQQPVGRGEPGKLDPVQYYGFGSEINQNLRGELKPQVVMRVRSQAAGFWRVMGFDRYTGKGWEVSRNDEARTISRPSWTYQFFLERPITLNRFREIVQTYTIVSEEMPNVIPALLQPKELYFPTQQVAMDPEGSLRSPLALTEGFTYTVISEVPYRDRTRLRNSPRTYPKLIEKYYLQLPTRILDRVSQRTKEILATSEQILDSPYEKALYLTQYLKQNYEILPEMPFWELNQDMTEAFLFVYRGGYPDHFATVLTVMLRSIGIPARLATGFAPGEFNPFTGFYVIRNTDAHAITEVYFPKYGWFAFDPIPGHELYPPSIEDYETFTILETFWKWVAGWLPTPLRSWLNGAIAAVMGFLGRTIGWFLALFSQGWLGVLLGLIILTCLGFVGWLLWTGWQAWRYQRFLAKLPPMERLYRRMVNWLTQQGCGKRPADTPLEYAQVVRRRYSSTVAQLVDEISQAYMQWRYGGQLGNIQSLTQTLKALKRQPIGKSSS
jgi:transglutaminase-like putative cysteine protease